MLRQLPVPVVGEVYQTEQPRYVDGAFMVRPYHQPVFVQETEYALMTEATARRREQDRQLHKMRERRLAEIEGLQRDRLVHVLDCVRDGDQLERLRPIHKPAASPPAPPTAETRGPAAAQSPHPDQDPRTPDPDPAPVEPQPSPIQALAGTPVYVQTTVTQPIPVPFFAMPTVGQMTLLAPAQP